MFQTNTFRFAMICLMLCLLMSCSSGSDSEPVDQGPTLSSRAYKGHESDMDSNNLVGVYPALAGTRLDDCQTCHRAGVSGTDTETVYNPCDYCHLIEFPNDRYETGVPQDFGDTLNDFGLAYHLAGRDRNALTAIAGEDSDGDGFGNDEEIAELRYPGSAESHPDQLLAPYKVFNAADIAALPQHSQFMLMVTTRQQFDDYVTYSGVRVVDLLQAAGVDPAGAEGITVFAPDGFSKDISIADVTTRYPNGIFYQTPAFVDPDMELVNYPAVLPDGIADGREIPDALWLLMATHREGVALDTSYYDEEGRLTGEGPYRLAVPQIVASRPDRSVRLDPYNDGWDYDENIDHNAGNAVRGACVIRVNPMPEGYEEFDWKNGWSLIDEGRIVIYGYGVAEDSI